MNSTSTIPTLLDVALSLTFLFFIVSMFVSGIWEFVGTVIRDKRATLLRASLEQMISSKAFANYIYNHPLIKGSVVIRPQQKLEEWLGNSIHRVRVDLNSSLKAGSDLQTGPDLAQKLIPLEARLGTVATENKAKLHIVNYPSYIAPSVFSPIFLDLLKEISLGPDVDPTKGQTTDQFDEIKGWINSLHIEGPTTATDDPKKLFALDSRVEFQRILTALMQDARNTKELMVNIENWYNEYMSRLAGYYKAYSQQGVRLVAVFVVVLLNLDAFNLTIRLYNDKPLRDATVADAISFTKAVHDTLDKNQNKDVFNFYKQSITTKFQTDSAALTKKTPWTHEDSVRFTKLKQNKNLLMDNRRQFAMIFQPSDTLANQFKVLMGEKDYIEQLPFGWTRLLDDYQTDKSSYHLSFFLKILLGWLLMVAAVSFGAPFWFDILVKLVNIRNAGKNPADKSK